MPQSAPVTFTATVEIARPVHQVWNAFVDRSLMPKWQSTLKEIHPVAGDPGVIGARTRLTYREAGRDVQIEETVVESAKPTALVLSLTSSMMESTMANRFSRASDEHTRWHVECEIRFHGVWKVLGLLGKRMLVRKTEDDMKRFKGLAESLDRDA